MDEFVMEQSSNLEKNGIFLFTKQVSAESCAEAMQFIFEANLNKERSFDKIQLIINSPGGDLPSAFALCDVIQGSRLPVYTTGLGFIASAGLAIFMCGERGHRIITPNTLILSHQWSSGNVGKEHELLAQLKGFEILQNMIIEHYKRYTGLTVINIKKYLLPPSDIWLTPEEAIKYKLADKIVFPKKQIKDIMS